MIFRSRKHIRITIKLYSGLDKDAGIAGYDPGNGLLLQVRENTRLKSVLSKAGLKNLTSNAYFLEGRRIGLWKKLSDGDEIACMKPSAGG